MKIKIEITERERQALYAIEIIGKCLDKTGEYRAFMTEFDCLAKINKKIYSAKYDSPTDKQRKKGR